VFATFTIFENVIACKLVWYISIICRELSR